MPRAETTLVRIDDSADDKLVVVAKRLGVSKACLLAGFAAWTARGKDAADPADVLPIELRQAIDEAAKGAVQRQANGAYRGSLARGAQVTANGGPKRRP